MKKNKGRFLSKRRSDMKNNGIVSILITFVIMLLVVAINVLPVSAEEKGEKAAVGISPKVEISFVYQRQTGMGSNQFAVWIEDSSGKYIKTLYTTRFTANGGWQRRPQSLPGWVKASQAVNMTSGDIDAITGATPSSGNLTYVWDCKDKEGNIVTAGEYKYIVEASLRMDNRVLYSGTIKTGGKAQQSQAASEFFGDSEQERGMITNVAAKYYP
jgi:hypothetical protein